MYVEVDVLVVLDELVVAVELVVLVFAVVLVAPIVKVCPGWIVCALILFADSTALMVVLNFCEMAQTESPDLTVYVVAASAEVTPANSNAAAATEVVKAVVKSFFKLYTPIFCESCVVLINDFSIAGAYYLAVSRILSLNGKTLRT